MTGGCIKATAGDSQIGGGGASSSVGGAASNGGGGNGNKKCNAGAGAATGDSEDDNIKLSPQIGPLFEIMTNVLRMPGVHNHRLLLDPISKLVSYAIQNCTVSLQHMAAVCYMCNRYVVLASFLIQHWSSQNTVFVHDFLYSP